MRVRIIIGHLLIVLVTGLIAYALVRSELTGAAKVDLDKRAQNDRVLLQRGFELAERRLSDAVRLRASSENVSGIFTALDAETRRRRAFEVSEGVARWFGERSRGFSGRPDIVVVTDGRGRVLARDTDEKRMFGQELVDDVPGLTSVLQTGASIHDAWRVRDADKVLRFAASPIRNNEGTVVGALVVGFDFSDAFASAISDRLECEVAFVIDDQVYSSSSSLEGARLHSLAKRLEGEDRARFAAAAEDEGSGTLAFELAGDSYVARLGRLPGLTSVPVSFIVLEGRDSAAVRPAVASYVLAMTGLALLLVFAYGFVVSNSVLEPIERIEDAILGALNGTNDEPIELDDEDFGGLAYRVNQLIATLNEREKERATDSEALLSLEPGVRPDDGSRS